MSDIASNLANIIADQVRIYFANSSMEAEISEKAEDVFFYNWMSLILLANPDFRLLVKVHCNESDVRCLAHEALKMVEAESHQGMSDFLKELANVLGGSIKRALEASDVKVGLSLPLMIRGFDELFAVKSQDSDYSYVVLSSQGQKVTVQLHFDFLTEDAKNILKDIRFSKVQEASGEFEFL